MSDEKKSQPKPDDLTKPTDSETIELTEEDLKRLAGGGGVKISDKHTS
jgi:hypothetical protein